MNDVLVAGHICLDIIPGIAGQVAFDPGRLIQVGPARISTGGAVSNTGLALHKLGVKTSLAGKIGDDLFGHAIRDVLERNGAGLGQGLAVSPGEASSYTIVISLTGVDRMFLHAPGCNDTFVAADVSDEALANTRLLHFGYPTLMARMFEDDGRELEWLFRRAKSLGVTTSLDVSLPDLAGSAGRADWFKILALVLPHTDLFLPSADEILFMLNRNAFEKLNGDCVPFSSFSRLAGMAIDMGANVVGIKAGSRGLYVRTRGSFTDMGRGAPSNLDDWQSRELFAPVFQVDVAGTTGAGDATIAGLLMGWIQGMTPEDAVRAASAVGACCCEQSDAVSGVRTWPETEQRLVAGWDTVTCDIGSGWQTSGQVFSRRWVSLDD